MTKSVATTAAIFFALTSATNLSIQATAGDDWIGKRVVPKSGKFALIVNGEEVDCTGKGIDFYKVEQVDGASVLLKPELRGPSGWAAADHVVAAEQAVEFFTEQIRAHPDDPFFHAARALLLSGKKPHESALRDYNEAIRLDPHNAAYYRCRGLVWSLEKNAEKAIADFNEAIRLDPKESLSYTGRGAAWADIKQYGKAIADDSEAIWLDPLAIDAYDNRAVAWFAKKEFAKAIVDENMVLRLDSRRAMAYCNRGNAWAALGKFDKALADFDQAVSVNEKLACAYARRAWIWATCPNGIYRDGSKALVSATLACELSDWNDPALLAVLAAAHAETGDFASAIKWQTRANRLRNEAEDKSEGESRLNLFEQKRPVRDPES